VLVQGCRRIYVKREKVASEPEGAWNVNDLNPSKGGPADHQNFFCWQSDDGPLRRHPYGHPARNPPSLPPAPALLSPAPRTSTTAPPPPADPAGAEALHGGMPRHPSATSIDRGLAGVSRRPREALMDVIVDEGSIPEQPRQAACARHAIRRRW
jgi:hypothetical protein